MDALAKQFLGETHGLGRPAGNLAGNGGGLGEQLGEEPAPVKRSRKS